MLNLTLLSRAQFAFTISFHIVFPAFSIGLALFIMIMEAMWLKTNKAHYLEICKFWTKIFALTFGMGVVSGIVMEFQLGTNFSGFTRMAGGVLGALFTYEVLSAFFIEAGFLGVMLFGWDRVDKKLHFCATALVVIGTTLSAYWILCANTWMQHPVGYHVEKEVFTTTAWRDILLNPMLFPRLIHMLLAAYISAGFVISSVSAYYLLKKIHIQFSKTCFSTVWILLPLLVPLQIFTGDLVGEKVVHYQPLKTAAIESIWESGSGLPFVFIAWPDQNLQVNRYAITIPHLASLINTHQWNGKMRGLKSVSRDLQPNVPLVFFAFRMMVGAGVLMLLLAASSLFLRYKHKLFENKFFLRTCLVSSPLGFIALISGWVTAEIGRQPWVIYGLLKTEDAISNVSPLHVLIGFILIFIVYVIIFGYFYLYYFNKILQHGPSSNIESKAPFAYMPIADQKDENK